MKLQMEMTLAKSKPCRRTLGQKRRTRARWWFDQMRAVVESAIDWKTVPAPPPVQTYLTFRAERR